MKGYLLDTNVISELRKRKRADANVLSWFARIPEDALFLSVLVLGEIRTGIERLRPRDPAQARALEGWLATLQDSYSERLLPITAEITDRWGRLNAPDRLPVIDSLMAATALEHELELVTRNTDDLAPTGVPLLNPFIPLQPQAGRA